MTACARRRRERSRYAALPIECAEMRKDGARMAMRCYARKRSATYPSAIIEINPVRAVMNAPLRTAERSLPAGSGATSPIRHQPIYIRNAWQKEAAPETT